MCYRLITYSRARTQRELQLFHDTSGIGTVQLALVVECLLETYCMICYWLAQYEKKTCFDTKLYFYLAPINNCFHGLIVIEKVNGFKLR